MFRGVLIATFLAISVVAPSHNPDVRTVAMQCRPGYDEEQPGCIEAPDPNSSGASAQCRDGSFSHSHHHSGTCSGHGGVAQWESYTRQGGDEQGSRGQLAQFRCLLSCTFSVGSAPLMPRPPWTIDTPLSPSAGAAAR
jgi:hypothetical protein